MFINKINNNDRNETNKVYQIMFQSNLVQTVSMLNSKVKLADFNQDIQN